MKSAAWTGDWAVTQAWGATDVIFEPYWQAAQTRWHCGIDVGMPSGTNLYAIRGGEVCWVGAGLMGIHVGNDAQGKPVVDWYVHGFRYALRAGQSVRRGDFIGLSGAVAPSGGFVTGAHLHFEVQDGDARGITALNDPPTSCDPVPVLTGVYGAASGGRSAMSQLDDIQNLLNAVNTVTLKRIEDKLDAVNAVTLGRIEAEVLKLAPGVGALVDLAPVLSAIADVKAVTVGIKAKTDKDLG